MQIKNLLLILLVITNLPVFGQNLDRTLTNTETKDLLEELSQLLEESKNQTISDVLNKDNLIFCMSDEGNTNTYLYQVSIYGQTNIGFYSVRIDVMTLGSTYTSIYCNLDFQSIYFIIQHSKYIKLRDIYILCLQYESNFSKTLTKKGTRVSDFFGF